MVETIETGQIPTPVGSESQDTGFELDELLARAVARQESLKMPKAKPHWKQALQKRLEARRRQRELPSYLAYRERLQRSLRRKYYRWRHEQLRRGIVVELAYSEWALMWAVCPLVNGGPAYLQTGREKGRVRVERLDTTQSWSRSNIQIVQGKNVLWRDE